VVLGLGNTYDVSVKFLADLRGYTQNVEKASKKMEEYGKRVGKVGKSLTKNLTLPIVAIGTAAINASMKFNKGMANVASLMPGNTERMLELKDAVLDLAVSIGEQPGMLTDGLYEMISAFGDSTDTMKNMTLMAQMAKAGQATLKEAIKLTSGVTKAYGDTSFEAMQKVSDLSLLTVRLGQTTFPELAASLGQVVPLTGALNIGIEETMAVMATLTGVTGNTTEVATQFASALTGVIKKSAAMKNALHKLEDVTIETLFAERGFVGALQALVDTTDGSNDALAELFGRKEAVLAVLTLLGPQAETFNQKLREMKDASGTTMEALDEQTKGLNAVGFQWDVFKAKLTTIAIRIGDTLTPALTELLDEAIMPLLDKIIELVKQFTDLDSATQQNILKWTAIIALAGPFLVVLSSILTAVAAIVGVIGAVGAGILAIIGGLTWIITHWSEFTESWRGAWLQIERYVIELGIAISGIWEAIYEDWVELWDSIVSYFALQVEKIKNKAGELARGIVKPFEWLKDKLIGHSIIPEMVTGILLEFARMEKGINRVMERVEDAMRDAFSSMPEIVQSAFAKMEAGTGGASWRLSKAMSDKIGGERGGTSPFGDLATERRRYLKENDKTEKTIEKAFTDIEKTLLGAARMLGKSIVSGDIASALSNIFSMIGNAISTDISGMIKESIGGGGLFGSIMGALGGGIVSGLFSLAGGLFGGGGRGEDESSPVFVSAHISNWEQFFQFGATLPVSFVYSGRSGAYDVDPHGRTAQGYLRGEHFDA